MRWWRLVVSRTTLWDAKWLSWNNFVNSIVSLLINSMQQIFIEVQPSSSLSMARCSPSLFFIDVIVGWGEALIEQFFIKIRYFDFSWSSKLNWSRCHDQILLTQSFTKSEMFVLYWRSHIITNAKPHRIWNLTFVVLHEIPRLKIIDFATLINTSSDKSIFNFYSISINHQLLSCFFRFHIIYKSLQT